MLAVDWDIKQLKIKQELIFAHKSMSRDFRIMCDKALRVQEVDCVNSIAQTELTKMRVYLVRLAPGTDDVIHSICQDQFFTSLSLF